MELREESPPVEIARIESAPDAEIVRIFRTAFPQHPISRLSPALTASMLAAFAADATFLAALDARTGENVGFAVGGEAFQLNRARMKFIRRHFLRIAGASARSGNLWRLARARVRRTKRVPPAQDAPYQLRLIAVSPAARSAGVGSALLRAFEATLPRGASYHVWILASNAQAERFYRMHGAAPDLEVDGHVRLKKTLPA